MGVEATGRLVGKLLFGLGECWCTGFFRRSVGEGTISRTSVGSATFTTVDRVVRWSSVQRLLSHGALQDDRSELPDELQ